MKNKKKSREEELEALKMGDLRDLLKKDKLFTSGNKTVLVERILEHERKQSKPKTKKGKRVIFFLFK